MPAQCRHTVRSSAYRCATLALTVDLFELQIVTLSNLFRLFCVFSFSKLVRDKRTDVLTNEEKPILRHIRNVARKMKHVCPFIAAFCMRRV